MKAPGHGAMNREMHPQAGETAVIRLSTTMDPLMRRFVPSIARSVVLYRSACSPGVRLSDLRTVQPLS